jgi:hypothetical protein
MPSCLRELRSDMNIIESVKDTASDVSKGTSDAIKLEDDKELKTTETKEIAEIVYEEAQQETKIEVLVVSQEELVVAPQIEEVVKTSEVTPIPTSRLVGRKRKI